MVSIIIPAYNEEKRILRTLEAYTAEFHAPHELIVVLNGCTDGTLDVVNGFISTHPDAPVRVMNVREAIGKGGAIRKGFDSAKGDYIGFVDADLATPVKDFQKLHDFLERNPDFDGAIASRLKSGSLVHDRGPVRTIVSHLFSSLVRFITDIDFQDTQCGAKLFRGAKLKTMLPGLTASDMTIDVDLLLSAQKYRFRIEEIPTEWFDRSSSALLGSPLGLIKNGGRMFRSLILLQRKYDSL